LKDLGEILLSKFKWGQAFYNVNRDLLDQYAACDTANDVSGVEKRYLDELGKSGDEDRLRG
jgi:pre-rRNA-processing protein TSR3